MDFNLPRSTCAWMSLYEEFIQESPDQQLLKCFHLLRLFFAWQVNFCWAFFPHLAERLKSHGKYVYPCSALQSKNYTDFKIKVLPVKTQHLPSTSEKRTAPAELELMLAPLHKAERGQSWFGFWFSSLSGTASPSLALQGCLGAPQITQEPWLEPLPERSQAWGNPPHQAGFPTVPAPGSIHTEDP